MTLDVSELNAQLEHADAAEVLRWAWTTFAGAIAASSSFQTQSVPLLHLISQTTPEMPVMFLDTGFHFPETLAFRDQLVRQMGLRVQNLTPAMGHGGFLQEHGRLYRENPDLCCHINKVEPLRRAMTGLRAWVTGIRRDQTANRASTPIIEVESDGTVKIAPMATWTERDVWRYMNEHDLPSHPLFSAGYISVGCAPCTRPVQIGGDARSGRWAGTDKTECGLHTPGALTPLRAKARSET